MCLADEVMNIGDMMCARKYDHDMGRVAFYFSRIRKWVWCSTVLFDNFGCVLDKFPLQGYKDNLYGANIF